RENMSRAAPESETVTRIEREYRGVRLCDSGAWAADIWHPILEEKVCIGTFSSAEEASEAYEDQRQFFELICKTHHFGVYQDLLLTQNIVEDFDALSIADAKAKVLDEMPPQDEISVVDFDDGFVDDNPFPNLLANASFDDSLVDASCFFGASSTSLIMSPEPLDYV
ncbi:hypothetical protein MIMGU_mgv1a024008mg, partial [Erythranthe guttata]